jgi:hypothetical protein
LAGSAAAVTAVATSATAAVATTAGRQNAKAAAVERKASARDLSPAGGRVSEAAEGLQSPRTSHARAGDQLPSEEREEQEDEE